MIFLEIFLYLHTRTSLKGDLQGFPIKIMCAVLWSISSVTRGHGMFLGRM